jgi:hypothetical protein
MILRTGTGTYMLCGSASLVLGVRWSFPSLYCRWAHDANNVITEPSGFQPLPSLNNRLFTSTVTLNEHFIVFFLNSYNTNSTTKDIN